MLTDSKAVMMAVMIVDSMMVVMIVDFMAVMIIDSVDLMADK